MLHTEDKRSFYRMMVNKEVSITVVDAEANADVSAVCRDLSATGMAVELSHPLELGTRVRAKVDSGTANVLALDVSGKVVRCIEESEDAYLVGIEIQELD